MKRVLITGYTGFVGGHCTRLFREKGFEIVGLNHSAGRPEKRTLVDEEVVCNLADPAQIGKLVLRDIDAVVHLAGYATNTGDNSQIIDQINVWGTVELLRRIQNLGLDPRIVVASSGAVYDPEQPMPLTETSRRKSLQDARPYEASKIKMEDAVGELSGLDIVIARPFNHIGPEQTGRFIVPDLIRQVIEATHSGKPMVVGNLASERDYTSVYDVVWAYYLLATSPKLEHNLYNICSGVSISGNQILEMIIAGFGMEKKPQIMVDPGLLRGSQDNSKIVGSSERLTRELGWQPNHEIRDTIKDAVAWYTSTASVA